MRRQRVHGVDIARDLPCCHRCSDANLAVAASTDWHTSKAPTARSLLAVARLRQSYVPRTALSWLCPRPLPGSIIMTDGFSRPYATVARVARSLPRPTTVVQIENRRSGSRESRAAPRDGLKKARKAAPSTRASTTSPWATSRGCPAHTCGRRSQAQGATGTAVP